MLDDYKYSIGRLVVYKHPNPRLPRQSYGHYGHERTLGEIVGVEAVNTPHPHWVYSVKNVRNREIASIAEDQIRFAASAMGDFKKSSKSSRAEDGALAEMIAKALSNPERNGILRSTLREFVRKEELAARASREGADLPLQPGDYIRIRGDLRKETELLHNHYAKIVAVGPADIAGIENPYAKPGQPRLLRTLKRYQVVSPEGVKTEIYDAEVKLFYTANGRKTMLNWRAATLLAEAFDDQPPYHVDFDYVAEHIFTRDELKECKRSELVNMFATLLYVKGKIGLRDYHRRKQFTAVAPRSHIVDGILEMSRFDARNNRFMTDEEISARQQEYLKFSKLLQMN